MIRTISRAGISSARHGRLDDIAWFGDNSGTERIDASRLLGENIDSYNARLVANGSGFHPVALKAANRFGLYDMLGNVLEWTADWYGETYYASGERRDPKGPPNGTRRVVRGGAWRFTTEMMRATVRVGREPERGGVDLRFRCVVD